MKRRVLLISRFCPDAVLAKHELETSHDMKVEWVRTSSEAIDALTKEFYTLLVIYMDAFATPKAEVIRNLRGLGYEYPVIILARTIAKGSEKVVGRMNQVVLLETPWSQKEFGGCLNKMIRGDAVKQRYFRRFMTNQATNIQLLKDGTEVKGKARNLSLGGALFEFTGTSLRRGDLVRVTFMLKELDKRYDMLAKVMWVMEESPWGGGKGAGLMFIKTEEMPARATV